MDNPYPWLQDFIDQVPAILQPVIVAVAAAIPYVEGEGAVTLGIIAGINPVVAFVAAAAGNILCVVAVVLLGSRIRGRVVARRQTQIEPTVFAGAGSTSGPVESSSAVAPSAGAARPDSSAPGDPGSPRQSKGRAKLRRWLVRFGVPGASLLAPIALPTMLTAAFFVASGVRKEWVILWQIVAIVAWTAAVAAVAAGILALLGW
ncbi:MAG: small multidrug efflux protein [Microbacterium sp.]